MSSASDRRDPKPDFVTGYPASASAATASCTAYPYPAPPPHAAPYYANSIPNANGYYQNPNPNYNGYYSNPSSGDRTLFVRRLLAFVVAIFLIVGAITFIVWVILRPKLPEVAVTSLDVSSFNISSSNSLSAEFNVNFTVQNPNSKMSIHYEDVGAAVLYRNDLIVHTSLPPFYQKTGDVTGMTAKLAVAANYVNDDVVKAIRADRSDGVVIFGVRALAIVQFRAGAWRTRNHLLRVYCDDIGVGFKTATSWVGSMVGPPKRCQVGL